MSANFNHDQLRVKALELAIGYWDGRSALPGDVVDTAADFLGFLTKYEEQLV